MEIPEEHRFSESYLQEKQKILAGIPEKNHKRMAAMIAGVAAAAVIVVVSGFMFGWFGSRKYTVTLANGDEVTYRKDGNSFGASDLVFDSPTSPRELTESEVKSIFPEDVVPDSAYAVFDSDTGDLCATVVRHVHLKDGREGTVASDLMMAASQAYLNDVTVFDSLFHYCKRCCTCSGVGIVQPLSRHRP